MKNDKMLGDAVAYRDDRTKDISTSCVYQFVSETELSQEPVFRSRALIPFISRWL